MLDIQNIGLVELNAQEVVTIEGGGWLQFIWNNIIVSGANDLFNTTSNTISGVVHFLTHG